MTVNSERLAVRVGKRRVGRHYKTLIGLTLLFIAICSLADAQQPRRVYRIGVLSNRSAIDSIDAAYQQRLRELGYFEGQNIVIERRMSKGKLDLLPKLATELVDLKVECLLSFGVAPTRAAKQATSTIPIVMGNADDDPTRHGLIASLSQPGGNITGFTSVSSELAGKRLELLKETAPKASRIGILWSPSAQGAAGHFRETEHAARLLKIQLQSFPLSVPDDVLNVFQAAANGNADALIVVSAGGMARYEAQVVSLALKTRVPVMYTNPRNVFAGGLMSYAADLLELSRGAAGYVDRILKGAKPADLPVQQPTKFELVINLKTAKQIGLAVPSDVLARANRVIR